MKIIQELLTVNPYSRPGKKIKEHLGIIYHWVGNANTPAMLNRNYFEDRKDGKNGYGSAHYIIDIDGSIMQCIPEDEVAYHCGSSKPDPVSGKIYTIWARQTFGVYCTNYQYNSPNNCTIGIEICHVDDDGNMTRKTIESALELGAELCRKYNLEPLGAVGTHNGVVGYKNCPKLWVDQPNLFMEFKLDMREMI